MKRRPIDPDVVVAATDLGKRYDIYERPSDRLRRGLLPGRRLCSEFWALQGVTFEARRGDVIGLVGRNGSGKSTLLQVLAGVLAPTAGEAFVRGRAAAVLELGCAFSAAHTGRENAILNAQLLGMSREDVLVKLPAIERFADIGDFFDRPLRVYSTGMHSRLAFAVYAHMDADLLLLDEIVSVGDSAFQRKCFRRLDELRDRGTTVILATHDTAVVRSVCDSAMMLEQGRLRAFGEPPTVVDEYLSMLLPRAASPGGDPCVERTVELGEARGDAAVAASFDHEFMRRVPPKMRFLGGSEQEPAGGRAAVVSAAMLLGPSGEPVSAVKVGSSCLVCSLLSVRLPVDHLAFGILIRDRLGRDIFGQTVTTVGLGIEAPLRRGDLIGIDIRFRCDLRQDTYFVTLGLGDAATEVRHFYGSDVLEFRVEPQGPPVFGLVDLPWSAEGRLLTRGHQAPESVAAIGSVGR